MAFWNPMTISSAISAGGSILSGMLGGGGKQTSTTQTLKILDAQRERNRYDAEHMPYHMRIGAENAGLHPSVVFGAGGYQPGPTTVIPAYNDPKPDWGNAVAGMSQNIGRAYMANKDAEERSDEIALARIRQAEIDKRNFENLDLQNLMLATQIRQINSQLPVPAPASPRSGRVTIGDPITQSTYETGQYKVNPTEITSANPHIRSITAGPESPSMTKYRFGGPNLGFNYELPAGSSASEALESMGGIAASGLTMGHNILRSADRLVYGDPATKPSEKLPPGYYWHWKPISRVWQARRRSN